MAPIGKDDTKVGMANKNNPNAPIGKKKKRKHTALWITLASIFTILVLPIGLVYGFCYDGSHKSLEELNIDPNKEYDDFFKSMTVDMLDNANVDGVNTVDIVFSEDSINQTIYQGFKTMDENAKSFVPGVYLEINEDQEKVKFVLELNAYGIFKTNVILTTTMEYVNEPAAGIKINIENIAIARLNFATDLILNIASNFINDSILEKSFKDAANITVESHLNEKYILYPRDNLVADLTSQIDIASDFSFFTTFMIDMIENENFSFSFYKDKEIKGVLQLEQFHINNDIHDDKFTNDLKGREKLDQYIIPLLNENELTQQQVNYILKFLCKGINELTESEKSFIETFRTTLEAKIGSTLEEYSTIQEECFRGTTSDKTLPVSGINDRYIENLVEQQIDTQIDEAAIADIILNEGGSIGPIVITEEDVHNLLKSSEAVGYNNVFYKDLGNSNYKANYFMVDNFYFNIIDNEIYILFGLNLNGYETEVVLGSSALIDSESAHIAKIHFPTSAEKMYYGSYPCGESLYNDFLEFVKNSLPTNTSDSWIYFDNTTKSFIIDFENTINNCPKVQTFNELYGSQYDLTYEIVSKGTSFADNGTIELTINVVKK